MLSIGKQGPSRFALKLRLYRLHELDRDLAAGEPGPQVDDLTIAEAHNELYAAFPEDYVDFVVWMIKENSGSIVPSAFSRHRGQY